MDVRSAIALQRKRFKTLPPKKKWEHILEYYKGWLLLGVILIAITGYSIYTAQTRKEPVLYVTMVNASDSESDVFQGFLENVGLDSERSCIDMNAALKLHLQSPSVQDAQTMEVLYALFGTGNLDLFAADDTVFDFFAQSGMLTDLRDYLPESFLKENADRLHTVVLSSGGKEIVAGIYPTSDSRFGHAGYYEPAAPVGIVTNAINLGTAAAALMWLSAIPE